MCCGGLGGFGVWVGLEQKLIGVTLDPHGTASQRRCIYSLAMCPVHITCWGGGDLGKGFEWPTLVYSPVEGPDVDRGQPLIPWTDVCLKGGGGGGC